MQTQLSGCLWLMSGKHEQCPAQHFPFAYFIIPIAYWKRGSAKEAFLKGLLLWKIKQLRKGGAAYGFHPCHSTKPKPCELPFYPISFSRSLVAHSLPLPHDTANAHSPLAPAVPQMPHISFSKMQQVQCLISLNYSFRSQLCLQMPSALCLGVVMSSLSLLQSPGTSKV